MYNLYYKIIIRYYVSWLIIPYTGYSIIIYDYNLNQAMIIL